MVDDDVANQSQLTSDDVIAWARGVKERYGLDEFWVVLTHRGDLELDMIVVPRAQRNQGVGAKVVGELIDFADRHGRRITLTPSQRVDPGGTTSRNRLIKFYKRLGFTLNRGRSQDFSISEMMYRDPDPAKFAPPTDTQVKESQTQEGGEGLDSTTPGSGAAGNWTVEDSNRAAAQGWNVFEVAGCYHIEGIDAMGVFESDDEAFAFVVDQARRGDPTAIKALRIDAVGDVALYPGDPWRGGAVLEEIDSREPVFNVKESQVEETDPRDGMEITCLSDLLEYFGADSIDGLHQTVFDATASGAWIQLHGADELNYEQADLLPEGFSLEAFRIGANPPETSDVFDSWFELPVAGRDVSHWLRELDVMVAQAERNADEDDALAPDLFGGESPDEHNEGSDEDILVAARAELGYSDLQVVAEHGRLWVVSPGSGGQWAVNESNWGWDFEMVREPEELEQDIGEVTGDRCTYCGDDDPDNAMFACSGCNQVICEACRGGDGLCPNCR